MTETDKQTQQLTQTSFRKCAIKSILTIRTQIPSFPRSVQIHAITIMDAYLKCFKNQN